MLLVVITEINFKSKKCVCEGGGVRCVCVQFPFVLSTDASEGDNGVKEGGTEGEETMNQGQQQEGEGLRLVICVYCSGSVPQGMLCNNTVVGVCHRACCAIAVGGLCAAGHVVQ